MRYMDRARRELDFEAFYEEEADNLAHVALLMVCDRDVASDLAQEALVRVYVSWHRIRGEDPRPYARKVLINLCRSYFRRKVLERRHLRDEPTQSPDMASQVDAAVDIRTALLSLSPIRRATVVLRFYGDMSEREIAAILERPVGTVKSDLRRALHILGPRLDEFVKGGSSNG